MKLEGRGSEVVSTRRNTLAGSVHKIIELIGTSPDSWEKAAATAVETASKTLRDLRIAEIVELDMQVRAGQQHLSLGLLRPVLNGVRSIRPS